MKKLIAMMLAGAMLFAATGCSSDNGGSTEDAVAKYGSDTLKLYNWGEYMGENLISDFEKEFGVKVIVEYFDSNEMMYTKLQGGDSYDVLVPSDYMIERLIADGADKFVEIGPGKTLTGFMRKINRDVAAVNIDKYEDFEKFVAESKNK